ncbi:MAG: hypothetical protein RL732_1473 [Bacteroidota bacterium]|jgi:hypothetical protein
MNTSQYPGLSAPIHQLGEQPKNLSGLSQGMSESTSTSTDENTFSVLIERFADWVYYQNELEFE